MEQYGDLDLSWSVGYGGTPLHYIDSSTLCHLTSNCLTSMDLDDGTTHFHRMPGDGIQNLTLNTSHGALAFTEDGINARIFVYKVDDLSEPHSVLSGGEGLGYTNLVFANNSSILVSSSDIPHVELQVWNWVESSLLCSIVLQSPLTCLTVNPTNWRHLCGSNSEGITMWTIARVSEEYYLQSRELELPYADGLFGQKDSGYTLDGGSRPATGHGSLKLSKSAVAGLVGTGKEDFDPTYEVERFQPHTHCWVSETHLYCSSHDNQLLDIDAESGSIQILYRPQTERKTSEGEAANDDDDDDADDDDDDDGHHDKETEDDEKAAEKQEDLFQFHCMAFHKEGLFVGGADGVIRCLNIVGGAVVQKFHMVVGNPISNFKFSPQYTQLAIASQHGTIQLYNLGEANAVELINDQCGSIVGINALSGDGFVVARSSGLVQVGSIDDSHWTGGLRINREICCLAASPTSNGVFLGTSLGSIIVLNLMVPDKPKMVHELFLHTAAVSQLKVATSGSVLVSGSSDGHLFILNGEVSTDLEVLGHTDISGNVVSLSILELNGGQRSWKVLAGVCSSDHKPGCNQLIEMEITESLLSKSSSLYMDNTLFLKDNSICKQNYLLKTFIYDITVVSRDAAYAIVHQGKQIAKLSLSTYENTPTNLVIEASVTHAGHGLHGGCIVSTHQGQWLASVAPDGYILVRTNTTMDKPIEVQSGNYRSGGLTHVCFSTDGRNILTTTKSGGVSCWKVPFSSHISHKKTIVMSKNILNISDIQLQTYDETPATDLAKAIAESHRLEDQKYAEVKGKLRSDIETLRTKVLQMMAENDAAPELERLERHEFNMDVEERQKFLMEQEKGIKEEQIRIELDDTAKQYQHHVIKSQCWEDMLVKGRSLKSFGGGTIVSNYPMKKRSDEELDELNGCVERRKVEVIETQLRRDMLPPDLASHPPLVESRGDMEVEDDASDDAELKSESAALYGSLGFAYGGANDLLHSQFVLHTRAQKRDQIILIQDCIHNIKVAFNKRFEEVYNFKVQEVRRITERNGRLRKIVSDMQLEGEEQTLDPTLDSYEVPENLLLVDDSEIKVEKYLSEKERKQLEEEERLEEERRRLEGLDNARERALDTMMAGRLETNLEEELKEELEEPEFFIKPQEEWSEEEQKLAKEFEKKKQQLNEEREKYRKFLESELKKLQTANAEAMSSFDERLGQLFQRQIKTEQVILQEELKICRLDASILTDEELEARIHELYNYLEVKKVEKQTSSLNVGNARREVEAFKEGYDLLLADEKSLDKTFRKEFPELDPHTLDLLYKLFKKRPRPQRTLKAASDKAEENMGNPFQERPSTSRVNSAVASSVEKAMQELDAEHNMPENLDPELWRRFILLRTNKVEKEQMVKSKALVLADMNAYLQSQVDLDEELKGIIVKTSQDIQRLREEKLRFNLNLEVQLLLKQGQVEVGNCDFVHNYSDSLLIHRSAVEDLNAAIKTLGEAKLASMRESKDFRKGIHQLEWKLKEMFMTAEDLQNACSDLQSLRVTKELQVYLSENDQRQSKQQEIGTLEKTLEMYKKMHQRNVSDRKRQIRSLKRQIREKSNENVQLEENLEQLSLSVAERKEINDVNADNRTEAGASKRMQDIITRRKLVDLAKSQANEIGMLRAEVERLRMRTFPALVQSGPM